MVASRLKPIRHQNNYVPKPEVPVCILSSLHPSKHPLGRWTCHSMMEEIAAIPDICTSSAR